MKIEPDTFGLRPLWTCLIEVYQEFAKVCDKHNLRYYVCAGSLLGALRHGGFIPWDDDFDVMMPRQDYEKLKELSAREFPLYLKWVDRYNTPEFPLMFGKIQDCRKERVEEIERSIGHMLPGGIFIDIYPIDGYPGSLIAEKWLKLKETFASMVYRFSARRTKARPSTLKGRVAQWMGLFLLPFFPLLNTYSRYCDWVDRHLRALPYSDNRRAGTCGCLVGKFQRVLECGWLGEPQEMKFENIRIKVPCRSDLLLRACYGDYMKLPPVEHRCSTHECSRRCAWWLGPTEGVKQ